VGGATNSSVSRNYPVVEHWTGTSWKRVALPANVAKVASSTEFIFSTIAASSSTNVWVFGTIPAPTGSFNYLHFNGKSWTTGKLPGTSVLEVSAVIAVGKSSAWVLGGKEKVSGTTFTGVPYAAEFNGHSWSAKSVPGSGVIGAASAVSAGNIWAVTGASALLGNFLGSKPSVVHWNGASWRAVAQPKKLPVGATLSAVSAGPKNTVWIAGNAANSTGATTAQFVDKLTGSVWAAAPIDLRDSAANGTCLPASLVPDGHGGLWALGLCLTSSGNSDLWHFIGGKSSAPAKPKFGGSYASLMQLARVPGTDSVWAAGQVQVGKATDGLIGVYGPTP
jgi:hypothetical protein